MWNAVGFKIAIEMELIAKHFYNVNARGDYTQMAFWAGGCLCLLWGRILLQNLINGFYRCTVQSGCADPINDTVN